MALRFNSLKTRTAIAIASLIAVLLLNHAIYLVLSKRSELREAIERETRTFARLSEREVVAAYDFKERLDPAELRERVAKTLALDPDVRRVRIVAGDGRVLFDSTATERPRPARDRLGEPALQQALQGAGVSAVPGRDAAGHEVVHVVIPHLDEEGGRRHLWLIYEASYQGLRRQLRSLVYTTGGLTLFSILAAALLAVVLAGRITRPIEELTAGAQDIADGHFDRRLSIHSHDEIQILAETFNHMTERLKENVAKLEESNRKLATVNDELKELDRLKSDLLANVSHELRTPLTAIKGYTDYILDRKLGPITEKQDKGLVVVQRNLDRLSRSINALLDFSRMDVGRISLNLQPFPLEGLIEQIQTSLGSELEKKGLVLDVSVEAGLPPVIADREKLGAVLENLVINAIKFTPPRGRIMVSAARVPEATRPAAELRVADTGIGIPPDQLGKIFSRFHQVDGSSTRRFGGVGLGLAIVKSILEAHGTSIRVESQVGHGTAFRFTLPVLEKPEVHEERAGGLVLVVDDEPEIRRVLRGSLEEHGLAVVTAASAAEAAALATSRRPDLVLIDAFLPEGSGVDLRDTLQGNPVTRSVPVLVTSLSGESLQAFDLGPAEVAKKPLDRGGLLSAASRMMGGKLLGRTVLVLAEDPGTATLIRDTLGSEGARTMVAHEARPAQEAARSRRPDLVIVDGARDLASLAGLGHDAALGQAPVLLLTAGGGDLPRSLETREVVREVRRHLGLPAEALRPASV